MTNIDTITVEQINQIATIEELRPIGRQLSEVVDDARGESIQASLKLSRGEISREEALAVHAETDRLEALYSAMSDRLFELKNA